MCFTMHSLLHRIPLSSSLPTALQRAQPQAFQLPLLPSTMPSNVILQCYKLLPTMPVYALLEELKLEELGPFELDFRAVGVRVITSLIVGAGSAIIRTVQRWSRLLYDISRLHRRWLLYNYLRLLVVDLPRTNHSWRRRLLSIDRLLRTRLLVILRRRLRRRNRPILRLQAVWWSYFGGRRVGWRREWRRRAWIRETSRRLVHFSWGCRRHGFRLYCCLEKLFAHCARRGFGFRCARGGSGVRH